MVCTAPTISSFHHVKTVLFVSDDGGIANREIADRCTTMCLLSLRRFVGPRGDSALLYAGLDSECYAAGERASEFLGGIHGGINSREPI